MAALKAADYRQRKKTMSRGVNKVILVGTLGADPETRYTTSGSAITTMRLATNESWKDKNTGQMQERTEWHRVKMFGRLAEIAAEYLRKGRQVYVEGSLRTEKYTDKDGIERYSTDIVANEMQMIGGAHAGEGGGADRSDRSEAAGGRGRQGGGYGRGGGNERGGYAANARSAPQGNARSNEPRRAQQPQHDPEYDPIPF